MNLTRSTLLKYGRYVAGMVAVAAVLLMVDVITDVRSDLAREANTDITYRDTVDGVDWYTYTNEIYGYAISFPEDVELYRSSEREDISFLPGTEKDVIVTLKSDTSYPLNAGANPNVSANSVANLRRFFINNVIPSHIRSGSSAGDDYRNKNYDLEEVEFKNRPALQVSSPTSEKIYTFNETGRIFFISSYNSEPLKEGPTQDRTQEIVETFTVLD